jgi:hypothetical protein
MPACISCHTHGNAPTTASSVHTTTQNIAQLTSPRQTNMVSCLGCCCGLWLLLLLLPAQHIDLQVLLQPRHHSSIPATAHRVNHVRATCADSTVRRNIVHQGCAGDSSEHTHVKAGRQASHVKGSRPDPAKYSLSVPSMMSSLIIMFVCATNPHPKHQA